MTAAPSPSAPRLVQLQAEAGEAYPEVRCPHCGHANVVVDGDEADIDPCPHLAFVHLGAIGDFEFTSEDFRARLAALGDDADFGLDGVEARLQRAGYGSELTVLVFDEAPAGHFRTVYRNLHGFVAPSGD